MYHDANVRRMKPSQVKRPISEDLSDWVVGKKKKTPLKMGKIRVGTRKYNPDGSYSDPKYKDYIPCVCLTASTTYGSLGPYVVRVVEEGDEKGALIENVWHSFKVLPTIPAVKSFVSRYDKTTAWEYGSCNHIKEGSSTVDMVSWLLWHDKLSHNAYPVRYPFSYSPEIRSTTRGVIDPDVVQTYRKNNNVQVFSDSLLGVAEGRKKVYFRYYIPAVKLQPKWHKLNAMLQSGENLLLIDVDGPRQESLDYYKRVYGVGDDFIESNSQMISGEVLKIMVNDIKHSCGHTYGLAASLLGLESLMLE